MFFQKALILTKVLRPLSFFLKNAGLKALYMKYYSVTVPVE